MSLRGRELILVLATAVQVCLPAIPASADWPMLGANPQRTSWVADEIRGAVSPVWYRPLEPYVNYKTQVIAADGKLFISTARGLYCLSADTGAVLWVYPTEVPLGHSPTYYNGRLYVGSYDRTIHAVDATTGRRVTGWNPYVALAGFETNPIVSNGRIYAGNRDGYFYCLEATTGGLVWRFKTGAAIRNSAAMDAENVIYFASEDLHAYALRDTGTTYQLVWQSAKLLGDTFSTYWPVVYRGWVIFSGGAGYFATPPYGDLTHLQWDDKEVNADLTQSPGTEPGDWAPGTVTMNASPILEYYENKPYRRRVFMLSRTDGREFTQDADGDGRPEYAPFTFTGTTHTGPKYPPVVGSDGVIYTNISAVARIGDFVPQGALSGWMVGTRFISRLQGTLQAGDEPMVFSMGGRLAYWSLCCDRASGGLDVTIPFGQRNREWLYWEYTARFSMFPGYEPMYYGDDGNGWGVYGGSQGIYGKHGAQNPWVPYNGKLYRVMGNAVVAVAPGGAATAPLPIAAIVPITDSTPVPSATDLLQWLGQEIQKMISAGHLKPGLFNSNGGDARLNGNGRTEMDQGLYYFANPGQTIDTLLRTLPFLSVPLQAQLRAYIQAEMAGYPIDTYAYVGHVDGAPRQAAAVPPDYAANYATFPRQTYVFNNLPWVFPMNAFYAAWKYAQVWPSEAGKLYNNLKPKITVPCVLADSQLLSSTYALNAYLAGYRGYLELEKMAGQPETASVRNEYTRLLSLRVSNFSIDAPWTGSVSGGFDYHKNFIMARHFLYLVPELAQELRQAKLSEVQSAVNRINVVTPYWFVEGYDTTHAEGTHQQLYDVATFNAYSMILQSPFSQLVKYLDAPVFQVGDLFFINNLVSTLEAAKRDGALGPAAPADVRIIR